MRLETLVLDVQLLTIPTILILVIVGLILLGLAISNKEGHGKGIASPLGLLAIGVIVACLGLWVAFMDPGFELALLE